MASCMAGAIESPETRIERRRLVVMKKMFNPHPLPAKKAYWSEVRTMERM